MALYFSFQTSLLVSFFLLIVGKGGGCIEDVKRRISEAKSVFSKYKCVRLNWKISLATQNKGSYSDDTGQVCLLESLFMVHGSWCMARRRRIC